MQVNAVDQGAAELALVAGHLVGRAAAGFLGGAQIAARAGVHGTNQLKTRRKLGPARRPRDGDGARLQRLAQGFERGAGKLGHFVQKQHTVVGQRDFAGPRRRAAADQGHRAGGVVRAAGGALRPALQRETPAQTGHGRTLQCFGGGHVRQQAGKTVRQHGVARPRWPHEKQAVPARRRNLQRPFGPQLAFHIGQVGVGQGLRLHGVGDARPARFCRGVLWRGLAVGGAEVLNQIEQMPRTEYLGIWHQGGLFGAAGGQDQPGDHAASVQGQAHGQRAAHRAQFAGQ